MAGEIAQQMRLIDEVVAQLDIRLSNNNPGRTNQFGYLRFDLSESSSTTRLSQYIRLALNTNAKTVVEFIQRAWRLPTPDLIISVTGGGKQCTMSPHLRKAFQRGLVAAAATTNAWLITAGANTGVIKEVGKALNHYRYKNRKHALDVPCIGISSWRHTAGTEQLDRTLKLPLSVRLENESVSSSLIETIPLTATNSGSIRAYSVKRMEKGRCELEPNHSHFLLFDSESNSAQDILVRRTEIEQHLRHINQTLSTCDNITPIVMVLLEGGTSAIQTVCQALESNVPLVVVKESGRAADLIADLHAFFTQLEIDYYVNEELTESRINQILDKHRMTKKSCFDEIKDFLCRVVRERKHLITIFKFDSEKHRGNLEDAILEALFNAAKFAEEIHNRLAELKLAMAWQKLDYARKHILTDRTISHWERDDLRRALLDALRRGHADFVELLIEYGASLEKLTFSDIEYLYQMDHGLPMETPVKATRDEYYSVYFDRILQACGGMKVIKKELVNDIRFLGHDARRELFLWAIFHDRINLAKYLCSKTWNQTVAALIGAGIYRLAAQMAIHSETREKYEKDADEFDQYAMSIIDECFDTDEHFAVELLKEKAVAFGHVEPLKVAQEADCRAFLASRCVQRYLDNQWFGKINYKRKAINFRIFFAALLFPLLPIFAILIPYVQEQKEVSTSKTGHGIVIRTVIKSDRDIVFTQDRWFDKIAHFYRAPIVRFFYSMIFYVLFLTLFSYVLLVDFYPWGVAYEHDYFGIGIAEMILHLWIWSLIIEELHKFYRMEFEEYFCDVWNLHKVNGIVLYLIGVLTRFIVDEIFFTFSKTCLCLDLIAWFINMLYLFTAFERLGPKLLMILNTMKDLLFFICFILIFFCGFSIASWSLISTTSQIHWEYDRYGHLMNITVNHLVNNSWSWPLAKDVINYGIWKIFGQIEEIEGTDWYSNIVFILAIIFVTIANVLLLNVLIALFNLTIQSVQERAHNLWRYQRFLIVTEYMKRIPVPPPFNTFYYLFIGLRYLARQRNSHRESMVNQRVRQEWIITDSMQRECAIADDFWHRIFQHGKKNPVELLLENIERKIDHVTSRRFHRQISEENDL